MTIVVETVTAVVVLPAAIFLLLQVGGADAFTVSSGTAVAIVLGLIGKLFWDKLEKVDKAITDIKTDLTHRIERIEDRVNAERKEV